MTTDQDYPLQYLEGLRLYNEGRFWDSHEEWEGLWREVEGAKRHFLQGLIQIDAALIHTRERHWSGVRNLLQRSLDHLERCPSHMMGMDVDGLRQQLIAFTHAIEELIVDPGAEFDWSLQPRLEVEGWEE